MDPEQAKKFSKIPFIVVLICLLFPWIKISCAPPNSSMEVELGTISGLKMITGGEFVPSEKASAGRSGGADKMDFNPNILALFTVLAAIGGLVMATQNSKMAMILAIVGLVCLFLLPFDPLGQLTPDLSKKPPVAQPQMQPKKSTTRTNVKIDPKQMEELGNKMAQTMMQAIKISHGWGAYLAILSLIAAIYLNFVVMNQEEIARNRYSSYPPGRDSGGGPSV